MGSSSSKFRKHLNNGDEFAALQLYNGSSDLRKGLDPNCSYGDTYCHDTPLHLAARHAMKSLLRIFLNELGGNPNKKNIRNETPLHCLAVVASGVTFSVQQRRAECLTLLLHWRGAVMADGVVEKVDLSAEDEKLSTPLHYAATSGMKRFVEILVAHGAPLFTENTLKQTPCDCAEKAYHSDIALYLESKMVFSNVDNNEDEMEEILGQIETEETYSGLRAQDLQEAKDQLLVETSDMLRVPLFTAEALLRNHEWSREMLLESWMEDAIACCDKCGVQPPVSMLDDEALSARGCQGDTIDNDLLTPVASVSSEMGDRECDICACMVSMTEDTVPMACAHQFCKSCWQTYLTGKIQDGEAHNITCPGFQCTKLVPVEVIETVVSRDVARRYLQFDIKAFVDSNPSIKWCPFPGCGRAVRLPESDNPLSPTFRGLNDMSSTADTSHAVDCGSGHMFCWECLGEAHEPASCEHWKKWHAKIAEVRPEELHSTEGEMESAANCLWLVSNSKPCPNCKSPIQKNEGCNHVKCSKCKHDFCWVCLEVWKKHSSSTGGYFRCNRYEVVKKVVEVQDSMKAEAEERNKRLQELNRFVHYYTRFKNHENSYKLELPLLSTAKEKMLILARAVTDPDTADAETKFVGDTVNQLLKARRVLKCSYVYGYYLSDSGYKKHIFEFMQTELEECTEILSEMVARPYLRTPRTRIIQTAHMVQRKRHEFVTAIAKGLIPPDTSPSLRKKRKQFTVELDDDLRQALLASMQELDPANPWVKAPSGKHTNISALLDWPEESDESDSDTLQAAAMIDSSSPDPTPTPPPQSEVTEEEPIATEPCARKGCSRPRVENPRTGEPHQHCSMRCKLLEERDDDSDEVTTSDLVTLDEAPEQFFTDYQMDLLRALEMSRLQFLREAGPPQAGEEGSDHSLRSDSNASQMAAPPPLTLSEAVAVRHLQLSESSGQECDVQIEPASDPEGALSDGDSDLRLAILLSLQETPTEATAAPPCDSKEDCALHTRPSGDPFSAQYTTVVTRVPNRSVEDLVTGFEAGAKADTSPALGRRVSESPSRSCELLEGATQRRRIHSSPPASSHDINCAEFLATCSRITGGGQKCSSSENVSLLPPAIDPGVGTEYEEDVDQPKTNPFVDQSKTNPDQPKMNPFGLIKDIRVANIVATDTDKTKEFASKDLRYALCEGGAADAHVRDDIFEPRRIVDPDDIQVEETGSSSSSWLATGEQRMYQLEVGDQIRNNCRTHIGSREMSPIDVGRNDLDTARRQRSSKCVDGDVNILMDSVLAKGQRTDAAPPRNDSAAEESADELVIKSEVLESLLHGAEQYLHDNDNPSSVNLPLLPLKRRSPVEDDESRSRGELAIEERRPSMRHSPARDANDVQTRRLLLAPECHSDSSDGEERDAVFV